MQTNLSLPNFRQERTIQQQSMMAFKIRSQQFESNRLLQSVPIQHLSIKFRGVHGNLMSTLPSHQALDDQALSASVFRKFWYDNSDIHYKNISLSVQPE